MQKIMLALFVTSLLAGCSTLGVYKVDIPQGIVQKIEGLETIPASQPGLPASKEAILNAPPL